MITLKLHKGLFTRRVGLLFEWGAWIESFTYFNIDPSDMDNLSEEDQYAGIVYGAAIRYCVKNKKRVTFDYQDIKKALRKTSMEQNQAIAEEMIKAKHPAWMTPEQFDEGKTIAKKK